MTSLTKLGATLIFSLLATMTGCGGSGQSPKTAAEASGEASDHAEVGKPAPDLSIHALNGKGDITLASLSGKTVIVDFWATWCGPCKQSFPKLEELQKKMGDGVVVVGVSVDDEESGVLDFAKENGATFPVGWDAGHKIASRWKVSTMPTSFIVDGAGVVRFIHAGYHDDEPELMAKEIMEISSSKPATAVAMGGSKKDDSADVNSANSKSDSTESAAVSLPADEQEKEPPPPPKKKKTKKAGKAPKKQPRKKA